jgi:amicyanin
MNRTAIITIGVVLGVAVVVVVAWLIMAANQPVTQTSNNSNGSNSTPNSTSDNVPLENQNNGNSGGDSNTASVTIQNMSFTPAHITVKKGTTVTWTNQDDMEHNVVSDSNAPAGGPPQTADLLSKGEVFSFTYNTVGTFAYHCTPHPFMQGTVEVTE